MHIMISHCFSDFDSGYDYVMFGLLVFGTLVKGMFSKPSGKLVVGPNVCLLSYKKNFKF